MTEAAPIWSDPLPVNRLERARDRAFDLAPDAAVRAALAGALDILGLRKLRFRGQLIPEGGADWRLVATLGATVVQPCGITMAPVTTRIDERVERRWTAAPGEPPEAARGEVEMTEDENTDDLGKVIDLGLVMAEALSLALPPFPRAEGAGFGQAAYAAPGLAPMDDDDAKPLAKLAEIRDRLAKKS